MLTAAAFFAATAAFAASPNQKVLAEAKCLATMGFTQGADEAAGKDFYAVLQVAAERVLGGKTIKVRSGNAAIRFASAITASSGAMEIAKQCKFENL